MEGGEEAPKTLPLITSIDDNEEEEADPKSCCGVCIKNKDRIKRVSWALFLGQVLAALMAGTCIGVALLAQVHVTLPLAEMSPQYGFLGIIFIVVRVTRTCMRKRKQGEQPIESRDHPTEGVCTVKNILLCSMSTLTDMHAYWATLSAYIYSNVTSIQLLDCSSIPTAMFLSYLMLRYRYTWTHYVGACVCIIGAAMMVGADMLLAQSASESGQSGNHSTAREDVLFGDFLALSGGVLFGVACVLQEYTVTHCGPINYLSIGPIVAAVVAAVYCVLIERRQLYEIFNYGTIDGFELPTITILYYFIYFVSITLMDIVLAFTITTISAVVVNLSILVTNVYVLLAGLFLFGYRFHILYFVAFGVILLGIILFAVRNARQLEVETIVVDEG